MIIPNFFVLLVGVVLTHANTGNNTEKTIQDLEKEKYELALKIQEAIEDSAKALQKSNDSDSLTGLEHLRELKKHFNETAIEDSKQFNASRRSEHPRYLQKGKVKLDLFDIANLFGNKGTTNKLVREKNQALMREKLSEWIKVKEQERKQIKAYKEKMSLISEKCPRNGLGDATKKDKKKKKKNRRSLDYKPSPSEEKRKLEKQEERREKNRRDRAEKRQASRKKYPCCRKCCKKSYLGCL